MIATPLVLIAAVSAFCLAPSSPEELVRLRAAAKANFTAHAPGSPMVDSAAPLPAAGDAKIEELRLLLQSAREIQLGCVRPCSRPEDALVYAGKVELVGQGLGLNARETAAAVRLYAPEGKPRLRAAGAPQGAVPPGDRLIEGKVLERLIADGRVAGQVRESMSRRASALAEALGRSPTTSAGGVSAYPGGNGAPRTMTAEQIAALNAVPRAQSEMLRGRTTAPPPPPAAQASARKASSGGGLLRLPEPTDYFDGKQNELLRAVYKDAEGIMKDPNYKHGTYPVFYRMAPDRLKKTMIAWEILKDHRYGDESKLTEHYGIKGMTSGEVADVDHFLAGALIGAVPVLGTTACAIGTVAYDGVQSAGGLVKGDMKAAAYDFKQMGADGKGCLYGFTILAPGG
ncbi:MAG: hypothetical protein HYX59_09105 [Elusimicrobia bacterium]|nr:hypothetical protein [Elusimicrobiota bacterium]